MLEILADGHAHSSRSIQEQLGICRRTVIRMSIMLEDVGFVVERERENGDASPRTYRLADPKRAAYITRWRGVA